MSKEPWTDPDPQPGDFDQFLESIEPGEPHYVEAHEGNSGGEADARGPGQRRGRRPA
jgi:hypothetical protein